MEVKNHYSYRGYRYDSETGLYYLQSRYYSPECGRFINADGIIGQTGELLGHNLFIYSKNNHVNMSGSDGFRPEFSGTGHDTGDSSADGFAIMNKRYDYSTGYINKNFDYGSSIDKGTKSGAIDKVGEVISGELIKDKSKWKNLGTMTLGKYVNNLSGGAKFSKKALGTVGAAGFALWDVGKDLKQGENFSAGVDAASAAIGFSAGFGICVLLSPIAAPAEVGLALEFGASAIVGIIVDKRATYIKDVHYGR